MKPRPRVSTSALRLWAAKKSSTSRRENIGATFPAKRRRPAFCSWRERNPLIRGFSVAVRLRCIKRRFFILACSLALALSFALCNSRGEKRAALPRDAVFPPKLHESYPARHGSVSRTSRGEKRRPEIKSAPLLLPPPLPLPLQSIMFLGLSIFTSGINVVIFYFYLFVSSTSARVAIDILSDWDCRFIALLLIVFCIALRLWCSIIDWIGFWRILSICCLRVSKLLLFLYE